MIEVARGLFPGIVFQEGSITALPADDRRWTGLMPLYSIIHTPSEPPPTVFTEFARVLRPGGRLPLAFHIGERQVHLDEWFGHSVSLDGSLLDPAQRATLLESAGFTIDAKVERRRYAGIELATDRAHLFARRLENRLRRHRPSAGRRESVRVEHRSRPVNRRHATAPNSSTSSSRSTTESPACLRTADSASEGMRACGPQSHITLARPRRSCSPAGIRAVDRRERADDRPRRRARRDEDVGAVNQTSGPEPVLSADMAPSRGRGEGDGASGAPMTGRGEAVLRRGPGGSALGARLIAGRRRRGVLWSWAHVGGLPVARARRVLQSRPHEPTASSLSSGQGRRRSSRSRRRGLRGGHRPGRGSCPGSPRAPRPARRRGRRFGPGRPPRLAVPMPAAVGAGPFLHSVPSMEDCGTRPR